MNVIAHNIAAMNANRQLGMNSKAVRMSIEKISSGFKINRASDDAAGLCISEKMRSQIRGLEQGAENLQDGISFVQVADGALNEVHSMLQRMNELSIQAANGTNSLDDRKAIDNEVQQLKTEIQRIFTNTTFNEKAVWPDDSIYATYKVSGQIYVQGVSVTTASTQKIPNNNNIYDIIAYGNYTILADTSGVKVQWRDYENQEHTTKAIDWQTLKDNNYSFMVGDYFDEQDTRLFDANNQPLFSFNIALSVQPEATPTDIIAAINKTTMSSSASVYQDVRLEDSNGNDNTPGYISFSTSIKYAAAYASQKNSGTDEGYDFAAPDDDYLRANTTSSGGNLTSMPSANATVGDPTTSTEGWEFSFYMEGIGNVTGKSTSVSYRSYDETDATENIFWYYYTNPSTGRVSKITTSISSSAHGNGTLGSVMDCLTGDINSSTPGLLTSAGVTNQGGYISIGFNLLAENEFEYGYKTTTTNQTTTNTPLKTKDVGSFTISIKVDNTDDEASVLNKITNALNDQTILDFYSKDTYQSITNHTISASKAKTALVARDTYSPTLAYGSNNLAIHGGPSTEDKLILNYQCLRLESIDLDYTNTLTMEDSMNAITKVGNAIDMISQQRSLFGAYQNRLEYSLAINENTAENTTAAESRIRDTDLAKETVNYSKGNILQQVGQSVLAQANISAEAILRLLS